MDAASSVAGLIGLAALVAQTTVQLRWLCQNYASAIEDVERVSSSLQTLQDLLEEATRLVKDPSIISATSMLTRSRMNTLLHQCQKDLELWTSRIAHHVPKSAATKLGQRWKKIIVAIDKPKLADLTVSVSQYIEQIDALLGVMRGDLGVATNVAVVASTWAQGIFHFKVKKRLEEIAHGVQNLQTSQDAFQGGTFGRLDAIGNAVGSIEVTLHDLVQQSSTTNKPTFKMTSEFGRNLLPYVRNRDFIGRKAIVEEIEHKLELADSHNRCAIYGLGGVGKSQVALEVTYRIQTLSPNISCYWVSAVSRTTFTQSYRDLASALQIPGNEDPNKDTLDLVKTWLRGDFSSKWLMIVDNVDDMKSLKGEGVETIDGGESEFNLLKYLPQCTHGKLLFTTRSKTAALRLTGNGPIVHIPAMDASEAQELLRVRLKEEGSAATMQDCLDLVKALEYLPLAVSHAASYIREMEITPARYLRMFNDGDRKRTKLLTHTYEDLARDDGQSNTVLTTWRISFEQIERDWPESASLLKLMGTLHWQDIPQYLLQQDDLEDEDDFQDAMNPLIAFSLVQKSPGLKTFSMHRLIHIAIKSWHQTLEFEYVAERLLVRVFPLLDINRVSVEQRQKCRQLLPHAQAIIDALAEQEETSLPSVQLRFRISLYIGVLGQYRRSRELGESLIGPVRELSDRGKSDISPSVLEDHITRMFLSEGNDKAALDRAQKALDLRKEVLQPDNPDLIRAKDLVAMSLMAQGKNQEAENQLREAHEALEKARGKRDLATILVLLNLAVAYSEQQRWKLSAEAYQAALDVLLPMYGDHNDCVIRCMEGLAEAERCLYRTQEGGELIRKAVALAEEINGPDHPYTLRAISRLGCQYYDEGNPVAGFKAFERVWKGYQRLYGDSSKLTLFALRLVAINHQDRSERVRLIHIALQYALELWGPSASKTRVIENDVVRMQALSGNRKKQKEAEACCRKLFENRKTELGHDNKWTLQAQTLLGRIMAATFRLDEGLLLIKDAAERQLKLLGETHVDLYESEDALILNYGNRDADYPSKVTLLHKHIQYLGQQRGPLNRGVLVLKSELGCSMWIYNKGLASAAAKKLAQEGGALMIEAYETSVKLYGDADVTTVEAGSRLARYYDQIKELAKAEPLHRKGVAAYRQQFGEESAETLFEESKLANCLVAQLRVKEALEVIDRIIPIQQREARSDPDRLPLVVNLVVSGIIKSVALWLFAEAEAALETLRVEIKRVRQLLIISEEAESVQKMDRVLRNLDNSIRDDILGDETNQWIAASAQPSDFKELEEFFPVKRHTDTTIMNTRRVKSWYLATAENRLYQKYNTHDRKADFASLRGECKYESTPPAGWRCSRCETPIPITDYFYRCYKASCNGGEYAVCQPCHNSGLTCLEFEHVPHRVKAYRVCNSCKKDITVRYAWNCDICEDGDYLMCKPCYGSGRRCEDSSHHMTKRLQECFKDHPWYGRLECDSCGNAVEDREGYEHCRICHDGDYDICAGCVALGIKCEDARHELERKVWRET